jgi:hypothetical protein
MGREVMMGEPNQLLRLQRVREKVVIEEGGDDSAVAWGCAVERRKWEGALSHEHMSLLYQAGVPKASPLTSTQFKNGCLQQSNGVLLELIMTRADPGIAGMR